MVCNAILVVLCTAITALLCNVCVVAVICQAPRNVVCYLIVCMVCSEAHVFFSQGRYNVPMRELCEICVFASLCMVYVVCIALVVSVSPWPSALPRLWRCSQTRLYDTHAEQR